MLSITIDANTIIKPQKSSSYADLDAYVEILLEIIQLIKCSWIGTYFCSKSIEILFEENFIPTFRELMDFISGSEITENADSISHLCSILYNAFFDNEQCFDEYFDIRDLETNYVIMDPNIDPSYPQNDLIKALQKINVILAYRGTNQYLIQSLDNCLFTNLIQTDGTISIKAEIANFNSKREKKSFPIIVDSDVIPSNNFLNLIEKIPQEYLETLWEKLDDEREFFIATKIAVYKYRRKRNLDSGWDSIDGFIFYPEFISSLQFYSKAKKSLLKATLETVCETIDGVNLRKSRELRTGKEATKPQIIRSDSAEAFRRDIDQHYRIHYWKCPNETIEFACVGPHESFDIPGRNRVC